MKKKKNISLTKLCITALVAMLILVLSLNMFTMLSVNAIKKGKSVRFGYFTAIIGSGSMKPALSVNDFLFIKSAPAYETGDIVTYVSPRNSLVTHRITSLSEQGYVTQGDANNIPDEAVSGQRILGKVVYVLPGIGELIHGILSPISIIFYASAFLFAYLFRRIRGEQSESEG